MLGWGSQQIRRIFGWNATRTSPQRLGCVAETRTAVGDYKLKSDVVFQSAGRVSHRLSLTESGWDRAVAASPSVRFLTWWKNRRRGKRNVFRRPWLELLECQGFKTIHMRERESERHLWACNYGAPTCWRKPSRTSGNDVISRPDPEPLDLHL